MNDPHVVSLRYRLVTSDDLKLDHPPRADWSYDNFDIAADDGIIVIFLKQHHSSVDEARDELTSFMDAWELDQGLFYGRRRVWFEFVDGELTDRDPPGPGEPQVITPFGIPSSEMIPPPTIHQALSYYPDPPIDLMVTPNTETLWNRYLSYRDGREPLPAMAYFCLTVIEYLAGGSVKGRRARAANMLNVDVAVLRKLGDLTANAGDPSSARKFPKETGAFRPLTKREERWIEDVIKLLVRRCSILQTPYSGPVVGTFVTMADLISLANDAGE